MDQTDPASPPEERAVLRPGETCWRFAQADRLAVIVDAEPYFAALHTALQQARHSVIMIGWEFDTRISLLPDADGERVPTRLGSFLNWTVRQTPDLNIYMLEWDMGMVQALGRGTTMFRIAHWIAGRRINLKLDHAHPVGATHHQKIVVIDDRLAFCGGIDTTTGRWDTRDHLDAHPLRKAPTTGKPYDPWHDATMAVEGEAARALGDLARERWKRATGDDLEPPPPDLPSCWPDGLPATFEDVRIAISRTAPAYDGRPAVHEIEALYLAVIAAAERCVYIESQYFASRRIAEAMAARLREPEGPEFVIVNPETSDGWLEEEVMGSSRARLLDMIRKADAHGRFRLYTPVAQEGTPIYVHAKIVVMDDRLLRVGSSNLNNRSMGMDTECDMSVEARAKAPEDAGLRSRITRLRNDLLAEHLDVTAEEVAAALEREGGLIAAVEALRGAGRTLVPFTPPELTQVEEEVLSENELLDPERPARGTSPRDLLSRLLD
ncbi:MAG: phospholipase D-like domain-containing protein [Salipiger marinus]|uniref:phospholipase D-like domain-containing protein n=1 Tax=Salipiger marinus TaxID=555512 RepID=UPI004059512A